jgi:dipeptidyl aminopeptidase/acylaminoacyl peptidase
MVDFKRVITKDDLFKFSWLQGAKLSPDGKYAIYTVSHIEENVRGKDGKNEDKEYLTLYLLDLNTGASRQMTSGKFKDSSPDWSPDSKTIAFVSNRDEKPQIYLLPVDGGEARQFTDLKQGASSPVWSPDGKHIAFTAGIDWGDKKPDRSKEPYLVKRNVWRFDMLNDLDLAVTNLYVAAVDSGDVRQLTDSPTIDGTLQWSPDSSHILFTAMMYPDNFKAYFPTVHTVDLDGNIEDILTGWASVSSAFWLPDGEHIVFVGRHDDDAPIGTHSDLWLYNIKTGRSENRTPTMELNLLGGLEGRTPNAALAAPFIGISDDGKDAYTRVQKGGTVGIYRIALSGQENWEAVVSGARTCMLLDMRCDKLLYTVDDLNNPHDLFSANLDGSGETQLTYLNDDFIADILQPEFLNLHFKGVDGADVEGWYIKPTTGAQAPYPTLLWIHGGPHSAQGFRYNFEVQMFAGAGYGVLYVNHRASTGYGNAFSTAIKGDWGNLDYKDLMAGVDYAIEQGLADADKLGVYGISGGGNLSTWTIGQTNRFKAAVPQNPVTNWVSFYGVSDIGVWFGVEQMGGHPHEVPETYRKCSPITYAHQCTTPTLLIQCEHDWRCPPEQSEQFYTVLRANGCIVEMLRQPGGSHGGSIGGTPPLRKSNLEYHLNWFNKYILGVEAGEVAESEMAEII